MDASLALQILGITVGLLFWAVFYLLRRVHRLEQAVGLREPEREFRAY